ncbi:hypothetical protein HYC85_022371 [Camellia sinensis]|uniref:Uncharacterized protein n=1 Tax=Camellia sinensis TaxID=4442 RepID=A0A7J7GP73_CAMSI|nr:hypothetical protein HYC85_022371 [Camellia sinensis]
MAAAAVAIVVVVVVIGWRWWWCGGDRGDGGNDSDDGSGSGSGGVVEVMFTLMVFNLKDNKKNNRITSPFISFANSVWIDRSFSLNPSYKRILEGSYNAKAKEVDFANKVLFYFLFLLIFLSSKMLINC